MRFHPGLRCQGTIDARAFLASRRKEFERITRQRALGGEQIVVEAADG